MRSNPGYTSNTVVYVNDTLMSGKPEHTGTLSDGCLCEANLPIVMFNCLSPEASAIVWHLKLVLICCLVHPLQMVCSVKCGAIQKMKQ